MTVFGFVRVRMKQKKRCRHWGIRIETKKGKFLSINCNDSVISVIFYNKYISVFVTLSATFV
jgi:hypothetical protein